MKKVISFIFLFIYLICFSFNNNFIEIKASDLYSDVFDDLRVDENFDPSNYPNMTYEETKEKQQPLLEIIQIAESSADELYLYVYEPTAHDLEIRATAISMSVDFSKNGSNLNTNIYELKLVSSYGVYNKYVVRDFKVNDEPYRYYNIVAIYREYIKEIDEIAGGVEETGNEIGISVGQQWCVYILNDEIVYEMGTFETLDIEIKYTGNFMFSNGFTIGSYFGSFKRGLSWFVSFNVEDYIIKHIYDADLLYRVRDMSYSVGLGADGTPTYGEWSDDIKLTLNDSDVGIFDGEGLFSRDFKWNRISTSEDFIKNAKKQDITITDECENYLKESQWVFAFTETEMTQVAGYGITTTFSKDIDKITILRIHFVDINNKIYNLGVVSDRVNPDNKSDGNGGIDLSAIGDLFELILALIAFILLIIILIVLFPVFKGLFDAFISIIKLAFDIVILFITLPFKLFKKDKF